MSSKDAGAMGEASGEKSALVPRLRFPGFREAARWKEKTLGDCLDYQQPTEYLVADTNYNNAYETPVLTAGKTFVLGYTNERHGIFSEGLPVIIFDDFTTATQFVDFPFKAKSSAMKILQAKSGENIKFVYEVMQMISYQAGVHERHWISRFAPMQILVPCPKEQQKIADCLSSIDELIMAETQELEALKTHKKGLVQQLFPREGETVPRLRFPEFRGDRGWEEKAIGDFGEVITGSTPSTARPEFYGGGIPFVSPADISDLRWVNDTKITLTALGFEETRPIKANSVLFVCIGSTIGKVTQNVRDCATNQQINSVIPNAKHSGGFVYYSLELNAERIAKLAGIQAVPIINKTQFSAVRLPVPELQEQERIADCLSSLDGLITAQSQRIDALKTHKKGLMQQLFPVLHKGQA